MTHDRPPRDFDADERRVLREAFRAAGGARVALDCPRCAVPLDRRSVPPRDDVSYVRDRLWVNCPSCHRTMVLDRRDPV